MKKVLIATALVLALASTSAMAQSGGSGGNGGGGSTGDSNTTNGQGGPSTMPVQTPNGTLSVDPATKQRVGQPVPNSATNGTQK